MSTKLLEDPLAAALFPKSRRCVLGLLFAHPDEAFYLRRIVELTGLGVGHLQREVKRLADAGILLREVRDRHVYFRPNSACPIYEELRGIVTKALGAVSVLREALRPLGSRIRVAFIFGSVARGEEREASDLDLMVVGEATFSAVASATRTAEVHLRREINPSVYPVRELVSKLRSGHHFLATVMRGEKVYIVGGEHELGALLKEPVDSGARVVARGNR